MIAPGLHDVPAGHVPAMVTHLEMFAPAMAGDMPFPDGITAPREVPDVATYRTLYAAVGAPWLWASRLTWEDAKLAATLSRDTTEVRVIRQDGTPVGLVELDFSEPGECELAYFGLVKEATGRGLGGPMMALAQSRAFARDIRRLWVHTCNLDDPRALAFYQKAGFKPFKLAVEIMPDPRLTGIHDRSAAPHVPLID